MLCSVEKNNGVQEIAALLEGKTTLLSGHSGVGKSTFINAVFPTLQLRTQEVSGWSGKGMHTTTFAEMFDLPTRGAIIDTPGIRELGLVDISKAVESRMFDLGIQYTPIIRLKDILKLIPDAELLVQEDYHAKV